MRGPRSILWGWMGLVLLTAGLRAEVLSVATVEGKLAQVQLGSEASLVELQTPGGTRRYRQTPNLDDLPPEVRGALEKLPGRSRPSLLDTGSQVRLHVCKDRLLTYEVTAPARSLWLLMVASSASPMAAQAVRAKALEKGFSAEVIESKDYPALKPGYHVTIVGAFTDRSGAEPLLARARKVWPDASLRQVRKS